ncbi:MAG: aminoacyl-tRNA hydrolase [Rhodospirillaceae bacterium]|mgnify:CR=1 FL=1|nr:aminoacyl-tRNA hydrolase [Rhodospirillaceae bacterium]
MPTIPVTPDLTIDENEIDLSFIRSSGPGGQNVNKVSSAVQLRFDARRSPSLPNMVAIRLLKIAGSKATSEGVIVITANRHRTQEMNRKDAIDRLVEMTRQATIAPKRRVKTKVTKASKAERLDSKKKRSGTKQGRRVRSSDWD